MAGEVLLQRIAEQTASRPLGFARELVRPLQNIVRYRQCGFHTVGPEGDQNKLVCTRVGEPKCPNWAGTQVVARAYYEMGRAWPCFAIAAGLRSSLVRNFVPRAGKRWLPVLSLQQLQR